MEKNHEEIKKALVKEVSLVRRRKPVYIRFNIFKHLVSFVLFLENFRYRCSADDNNLSQRVSLLLNGEKMKRAAAKSMPSEIRSTNINY